jgi:hypothetical protein
MVGLDLLGQHRSREAEPMRHQGWGLGLATHEWEGAHLVALAAE